MFPIIFSLFFLTSPVFGQSDYEDYEQYEYGDPNGIRVVFRYLEKHPQLITSIVIREDQILNYESGECLQYDYIRFKWVDRNRKNPFPDIINGNGFCTVVKCDDVFGPAESVVCSQYFFY